MKYLKIVLKTTFTIVLYELVKNVVENTTIRIEAKDEIDPQEVENRVFNEIAESKRKQRD